MAAWHDQPQPAGPCRAPHPFSSPGRRQRRTCSGRSMAGRRAGGRRREVPTLQPCGTALHRQHSHLAHPTADAMLGSSHARARWGRTHSRRRGGFGPNRIPQRTGPARCGSASGTGRPMPTITTTAPLHQGGVPHSSPQSNHTPPPGALARRLKPAGRGSTPSLALTVEATRRRAVEATRSHCGGP